MSLTVYEHVPMEAFDAALVVMFHNGDAGEQVNDLSFENQQLLNRAVDGGVVDEREVYPHVTFHITPTWNDVDTGVTTQTLKFSFRRDRLLSRCKNIQSLLSTEEMTVIRTNTYYNRINVSSLNPVVIDMYHRLVSRGYCRYTHPYRPQWHDEREVVKLPAFQITRDAKEVYLLLGVFAEWLQDDAIKAYSLQKLRAIILTEKAQDSVGYFKLVRVLTQYQHNCSSQDLANTLVTALAPGRAPIVHGGHGDTFYRLRQETPWFREKWEILQDALQDQGIQRGLLPIGGFNSDSSNPPVNPFAITSGPNGIPPTQGPLGAAQPNTGNTNGQPSNSQPGSSSGFSTPQRPLPAGPPPVFKFNPAVFPKK